MTADPRRLPDTPDDARMTIGEHLDELRGCLIRSIAAILIACIACVWPAKYLLGLIARPLVLALRRYGQPESFLATSPVEAFLVYIKVVLIAGIVIAAPYVIWQIWKFVAAGLYRHERHYVYRLLPVSIGLFFVGVVFMYLFVLLASLNFLVGFSAWLPMPDAHALPWEHFFLGSTPASMPASAPTSLPGVPFVLNDPADPALGSVWFNLAEHKLKLRGPAETFVAPMVPGETRAMVTTHLKLGEYLSFVLTLTIAFGLAFQVPLVVVFLVRSGIATLSQLRSYRRFVILIIVVIAAMIAPPDIFSHLLLSIPMVLLFELGLLMAARKPQPTA